MRSSDFFKLFFLRQLGLNIGDVVVRVAFFRDDDLSSSGFASVKRHELHGWSLEVALVVNGAEEG